MCQLYIHIYQQSAVVYSETHDSTPLLKPNNSSQIKINITENYYILPSMDRFVRKNNIEK